MESINEIDFMNEMTFKPPTAKDSKNNSILLFRMGRIDCFASFAEWGRPQENSPAIKKQIICFWLAAVLAELNEWLLSFGFLGWSARRAGYGRSSANGSARREDKRQERNQREGIIHEDKERE